MNRTELHPRREEPASTMKLCIREPVVASI